MLSRSGARLSAPCYAARRSRSRQLFLNVGRLPWIVRHIHLTMMVDGPVADVVVRNVGRSRRLLTIAACVFAWNPATPRERWFLAGAVVMLASVSERWATSSRRS